ncbi:MAG: protein kinase [Promethearchaeota archaeon]
MDKEGESGILYKVYSKKDDEPRVVKVYKDPIDNITLKLYLKDTKKLVDYKDEKIIQAFETGYVDYEGEKYFFSILEYIEGKSLEEIEKHIFWERNSYNERLELFNQVLSAIEVFRANYGLHNDLHLGNIMLTLDNKVKIIDFGSSKDSYSSAKPDLDLYLIKSNLIEFFLKPEEFAKLKKNVDLETFDFNQFKQFILERIEEKEEEQIKDIKNNTKKRAFELLKKVENINTKISEILPEYLNYLLEIQEEQEKIWVNIEISGNIHKSKKKYKEQLKYREILSYISKSRIIEPRGYSIEMIKAENPQLFIEHYWVADYTIQELEEIAIRGDTEILVGYYNREGIEFYNYTSVSAIKQILTRIRKKISEFLINLINS